MLQLNFTIHLQFMLNKLHPDCRSRMPITVIHGMSQKAAIFAEEAKAYPNVKVFLAPTPIPWGTHHTKAMLLFKENPSRCQLVVHTANLIPFDWENTTQYVWRSPWCHLKTIAQAAQSSLFEKDLVKYLAMYKSQASGYAEKVALYDWSSIKAVLIGSTPGRFKDRQIHDWGHMRLRKILHECIRQGADTDLVVCQFSSIGSLGKTDKWLQDEFGTSLRTSMKSSFISRKPPIKLIYPCEQDIRDSLNGWDAGVAVHYDARKDPDQTEWMRKVLHKWTGLRSGRHRAAPHIKTYMRFTSNDERANILWSLLTSANMSKAAWGALEKKETQFMIRSWELGVLVYSNYEQQLLPAWKTMRLDDREKEGAVPIRMPYDLPLVPYESNDEIWS